MGKVRLCEFQKLFGTRLTRGFKLPALRLKAIADILVETGTVGLGPFPHFLHDCRGY